VKFGIYSIAKNEENNLPGWYERVREADSVVVVDTGSTDNTFHAARDLGIDVTRLSSEFFRFDVARNAAMERSPADCDYLISQDLDERLEVGWRAKLEASLAENGDTDLATATLHHDGMSYAKSRIHSRKNWTWRRPVHEDLSWTGDRDCRLLMTGVNFEHLPDVAKPRSALYVNLMRIGVHEDPGAASPGTRWPSTTSGSVRLPECVPRSTSYWPSPDHPRATTWSTSRSGMTTSSKRSFWMPSVPPGGYDVEPSADVREAAHAMREFFVGLTNEGFNEKQALVIIGQMLAATFQAAAANDD
jgi:glycosyltransferase involved in cell wall biosynthesis